MRSTALVSLLLGLLILLGRTRLAAEESGPVAASVAFSDDAGVATAQESGPAAEMSDRHDDSGLPGDETSGPVTETLARAVSTLSCFFSAALNRARGKSLMTNSALPCLAK